MEDTHNKDKNKTSKLTISTAGKLQLSKGDGAQIKQNIAHGRSKTVTVEVKKNRSVKERSNDGVVEVPSSVIKNDVLQQEDDNISSLTDHEKSARIRALEHADKKYVFKSLLKVSEKPSLLDNPSEELGKEPEVTETKNHSIELSNEEVKDPIGIPIIDIPNKVVQDQPSTDAVKPSITKAVVREEEDEDDYDSSKKASKHSVSTKKVIKSEVTRKWTEDRRVYGKVSIANNDIPEDEEPVRSRSIASIKRAREKAKRFDLRNKETEKIAREVILPEVISIQELANRMAEKASEVLKQLMKLGVMATINQVIDADTAELIIHELGHKVKRVTESDVENILFGEQDPEELMVLRPPVVTVMGHVDHGKTTLLDALRSTDVVAGEAGGITQHIGAYRVELMNGKSITFLDTPGHEAFTAMRARGAKVTDIVVLVVAANDGIMAQTAEAINHAKAAKLPIIVAVNKIDLPGVNSQNIRNELLNYELVPEELGGDIIIVEVSAKTKKNIDKLEEAILLQADFLDLKANPNRMAVGTVIEAKVDKGRGVVTTLLVQKGTLKIGDIIVAGVSFGKVRAMHNDKGIQVKDAIPSMPVEIIGLNEAPEAGDLFSVVPTEKQAREISDYRSKRVREIRTARVHKLSLEELFSNHESLSQTKELSVIVRADVQGSVEAIVNNLLKMSNNEIIVKILHSAAGGITESDIVLAKASNAIILGFNVRANSPARLLADQERIELRYYSVIYDLIDEMKSIIGGMLSPIIREQILGTVEIRQVFNVGKFNKIAGCFVTNGIVRRNCKIRLLRDNVVIHTGKIKGLRRFKEDAREVREGFECGIVLENYDDIQEKDIIEAFEVIEEQQTF
ncbi:Translation initiation factor IF-2 [Rickettsiales bacterium Ac37b]|nr:Translation initiation factor IF-2 [Rickettsiales bacterium Ac37b]